MTYTIYSLRDKRSLWWERFQVGKGGEKGDYPDPERRDGYMTTQEVTIFIVKSGNHELLTFTEFVYLRLLYLIFQLNFLAETKIR